MATTFVGVEVGGSRVRPRHAAVVLHRRRGAVELRHWNCRLHTDEALLEYLAAEAGSSGVIAVHGRDTQNTAALLGRFYRVLDYRLLFALAPRHRTRALVRVDPAEVQRAFSPKVAAAAAPVLEAMSTLVPKVDFRPVTQYLITLAPSSEVRSQTTASLRASLSAYAALWCWWHGPAGYDVLGINSENYRLAPRMMDYEPDTGATPL